MNRKIVAGWLLVCLGLSTVATGWALARNAHAASLPEVALAGETAANDELIRVHVIANSDSAEDQALKLKVRDAVLAELAPRLAGAESVTEAEAVIAEALPALERVAGRVVDEQSFAYQVRAELGRFAFPGKSYGDLYLPAGEYKALRVVIGEGQGANFWCLVYPSYCYRIYEIQKPSGGIIAPGSGSESTDIW
ncbi:MAG: stage II sporulation protein R [Bacillota bacterium]